MFLLSRYRFSRTRRRRGSDIALPPRSKSRPRHRDFLEAALAIQLETPTVEAQIPLNGNSPAPSLSAVRHFANPSEAFAGHGDVDPVALYLQRLGDVQLLTLRRADRNAVGRRVSVDIRSAALDTRRAARTTRQRQNAHDRPLVPVSTARRDEHQRRRRRRVDHEVHRILSRFSGRTLACRCEKAEKKRNASARRATIRKISSRRRCSFTVCSKSSRLVIGCSEPLSNEFRGRYPIRVVCGGN